jgi:hypothetical protein
MENMAWSRIYASELCLQACKGESLVSGNQAFSVLSRKRGSSLYLKTLPSTNLSAMFLDVVHKPESRKKRLLGHPGAFFHTDAGKQDLSIIHKIYYYSQDLSITHKFHGWAITAT